MRNWLRRVLYILIVTLWVSSASRLQALPVTALPVPDTLVGTAATAAFVGSVYSRTSGGAIAGARISAAGCETYSDSSGAYRLELPPGVYAVRCEAEGYIGMTRTLVSLAEGELSLSFGMLVSQPTAAEQVIIDAELRQLSQDLPVEFDESQRDKGYGLSAVTQVPTSIRVLMTDGTVVVMPMDEYLQGVLPQEVPPTWPTEALRAQAVAARSYAATRYAHADQGADVCTTTHCQAWSSVHYDTTDRAVTNTSAVGAKYGSNIIEAFFFGHCDGHTRNSEDVWTSALPYCRSVVCPCGSIVGCPCSSGTLWGHGVGLCQEGARVLAQQGSDYVDILKHYYTGITVPGAPTGEIVEADVQPSSGNEYTEYAYELDYTQPLGEPPAAAYVVIDGISHTLSRVPEADEWLYRYVTTLSLGSHDFRFYVDDGAGHTLRVPASGVSAGPQVQAAEPGAPSPTPVPSPAGSARTHTWVHTTAEDWSAGIRENVTDSAVGDGALTLAAGNAQGQYTSPVLQAPWPFMAHGLLWQATVPLGASLLVETRTSPDGSSWSAWTPRPAASEPIPRRGMKSSELALGQASYLQYRLTFKGDGASAPVLESISLVGLDGEGAGASSDAALSGAAPPGLITRVQWGADEDAMALPPEYRLPRYIVIYQTGSSPGHLDPKAVLRAMYQYDAVVRERGDLGYHFLIDPTGHVYQGRAGGSGVVALHPARFDWGSIGIALLGDFSEQGPTAAAQDALTNLLAWLCREHLLNPQGSETLLARSVPVIFAHRTDETACPSERLATLLPTWRQITLSKLAIMPPALRLDVPADQGFARAVMRTQVVASAAISRTEYYVDEVLRATEQGGPAGWRWNTTLESDGEHNLRVVVYNYASQAQAQANVVVDNTPPQSQIDAPRWVKATNVTLQIDPGDARTMQLSRGWRWEGETLPHAAGTGSSVADPDAGHGSAWLGRAGSDAPGGWYGPYTCILPSWDSYTVTWRLKTVDTSQDVGLATLDIADDLGARIYTQKAISALDLPAADQYQDLDLDLVYESKWPTCQEEGASDGLEFRVWFSGAGDLYYDRVTAWAAPISARTTYAWTLDNEEGEQTVLVRLLDAAGNPQEHELTIGLDKSAPVWQSYGANSACVSDNLSGPQAASAQWSLSSDGGVSWGAWQAVTQIETPSVSVLCLTASPTGGTHLRFRISDAAGNSSTSGVIPVSPLSPTATMTVVATATITPTVSVTPSPSVSPTASQTPSPGPTLPRRLVLPLILR